MSERLKIFIEPEFWKSHGPTFTILGAVNLLSLKEIGELVLIGMGIAHYIWRWRLDARRESQKLNQKNINEHEL